MGKGQPYGSKVLTPSGWATIESLSVGDDVIDSSGSSSRVTGVYPKIEQNTYRVWFSDGVSFVVDTDHLHICRTNNDRRRGRPWRVMSTRELLGCGNLRYGQDGKSRNYDIPVVGDVEFSYCSLPIDPYVLGVLLGDGHLSGNIMLSTADAEIVEAVASGLPEGVTLNHRQSYDWSVNTGLTGTRRHPFRQSLAELGLLNTRSATKFIPDQYLFADTFSRLALLRGLMDTDGYIDCNGCCQFYSVSEALVDGVIHLIRSLGGLPTKRVKETYLNGVIHQPCHLATFSLAGHNPFSLSRKAERWNPSPRDNGRWIDRIEFEGRQRTVCISVDSSDSSYVTENFIVTHNTFMQIEWAKQIDGRVLILAPLAVANQTVCEAAKLGVEVVYLRKDNGKSKLVVANYEMLEHFDPSRFRGVVLDESSIIKHFDGKIRQQVIESFARTPYRLACTATPAPNDHMELGNHAEFVGAMTRTEMLSMFFVHDGGATSQWRIKGHAEKEFWRWVCSWAVMIRKPSDLGYDDGDFILPPLRIEQLTIESEVTAGLLFVEEARTLQERIGARRDSIEGRVRQCGELINGSCEPWLVWCNLNNESESLTKAIRGAVEIRGSESPDAKTEKLIAFVRGDIRVLVTKPSIAGFGLNFQHCRNVAFVGLSDSWEQYYQAVRRCWRFGQKQPVNVFIITSTAEGQVAANVRRKELDAERMINEMIVNMHDINEANIKGLAATKDEYATGHEKGDGWEMFLGDCVEQVADLADESIDYSIFSPPFASLYTYSASDRDMGNCADYGEFSKHFGFLVDQLLRVMLSGRLVSFHCMNLPTSKTHHGYIGIRDFRGDLIRVFEKSGFIFHSEVCIWKDPVTAMQRTKAIGLLHKQMVKDSCLSRQGIPDYLVTMRKPGVNPRPVSGELGKWVGDDSFRSNGRLSIDLWQRYASPVWMDINASRTLQRDSAREERDERHIAPLQLDVIERALMLWSNPGDRILSPFAGIGSEGFVAVREDRRFVGFELKESYFKQSVANLRQAEFDKLNLRTQDLFAAKTT